MRKRTGGMKGSFKGGRRWFQISMFGGIVLAGMLIMIFKMRTGAEAALYNKNSEITLYAKTAAGDVPALNAAKFFPDVKLNPAKFSYDLSGCDFNTPGIYRIPVFYGDNETDCVIQLEVLPSGRQIPETSGSMSGEELINGTGEAVTEPESNQQRK